MFNKKSRRQNVSQAATPVVELKPADLDQQIIQIQKYMSYTEDLKVQKMSLQGQLYAIMYIEVLAKLERIQTSVIEPLVTAQEGHLEQVLHTAEAKQTSNLVHMGQYLLEGYCIIVKEYEAAVMLLPASQMIARSIQEPKDEQVVKGSHDGFIEGINTNLHLLRSRLKNPGLTVKYFRLGSITNTRVAMVYMAHIAEPKLIAECEKRLNAIELEYLNSVGNLDEMLEEHPFSPFPQTLQTERPDRAASYLLEGKIALIVDGTPSVLILPITFFSFYQSPEDYNSRWITGSFFRVIRLISFILAICLPAIYIATVSYHSEVLPVGILYSVKVSLTYVPLPPILEALVMQTILELLKEAAIRLPAPIAQTIGIVGGLVIGTAVVEAKLVSHTMIVVIGLTAIASFVTPINEFGTSLRILGFPMMLAAACFGFFGISIMLMLIFIHLCKIETLGIPYFAPFGPFHGKENFKDVFLRLPLWMTNKASRSSNYGLLKQTLFGRWKRP